MQEEGPECASCTVQGQWNLQAYPLDNVDGPAKVDPLKRATSMYEMVIVLKKEGVQASGMVGILRTTFGWCVRRRGRPSEWELKFIPRPVAETLATQN